jgi:class 3 adenylate cyclase/tetratricopeptide (TPR) repeat protein
VLSCPDCGERNPEGARFCHACGLRLGIAGDPGEVRKTVSVLFSDITGSTALGERLDPESVRRVLSRYFRDMRSVLERHGGTVEKFVGDAIMAVFGIPVLHEDDALRAVRAAAEMRSSLASLNSELEKAYAVRLEVRTGVNTGEVVAGDPSAGETLVTGDTVNTGARLEESAAPGEIRIGEATYRLIRDAVVAEPVEPVTVRGKRSVVPAYRLLDIRADADRTARSLSSPLVGRGDERLALDGVFEEAAHGGGCRVVTILGMAGVGKSRLVHEFLSTLGSDATALRGRCLPYGEGITFWPVAEVVRQAAGIRADEGAESARARIRQLLEDRDHADRIAAGVTQMIGLGDTAGTPEEMSWGFRRFLEILAERGPLVVVFDDIHWGEPTFLDLLEYLADFAQGPILLLCLARLDLLDLRPSWLIAKRNAQTISLEPLSENESARLIENLLVQPGLDPAARANITSAAEGNPLFIEEMLRMLIDEGLLERRNGGWVATTDPSRVHVPPTISALLAARLERLDREELLVAQRASVMGKAFFWGAVAALTPEGERGEVGRHLQALVTKELIRPDSSSLEGEDTFRFRHILIRDAAYRAIPKRIRAELHERFAEWLEDRAGDRINEYEEIVGHHLEQASVNRAELGVVDERSAQLAKRAAERLAAAGRRAFARHDVPAAVSLLSRAAALLPRTEPNRIALLPDLGRALMEHGDLERADEVLTEAQREASASNDRVTQAHALLSSLLLHLYTEPEGKTEAIREGVDRVLPVFEAEGDERGLALASRLLAEIEWVGSRYGAVEPHLERAIQHARRAGDRRQEVEALAQMAASVLLGPTPAEQGIRRCREILEQSGGARRVEAAVLSVEAQLQAMRGLFEGTRERIGRAKAILEDLGASFRSTAPSEALAFVEMLAGDPAAAERELWWGYRALEQMGDRGFMSTAAAELAQAIYEQSRYEDADRLATVSIEGAASDDIASQAPARSVRAKILARRGESEPAEALAREAVEMLRSTDNLNMLGDGLVDLAEVLRGSGRASEAAAALTEAVEVYERKGNRVSAGRARATLDEVRAGTP